MKKIREELKLIIYYVTAHYANHYHCHKGLFLDNGKVGGGFYLILRSYVRTWKQFLQEFCFFVLHRFQNEFVVISKVKNRP